KTMQTVQSQSRIRSLTYDGQQWLKECLSKSVTDKFQGGVERAHGKRIWLQWMKFVTVCRIVARL
nr:hypothetical protein [bacterium]